MILFKKKGEQIYLMTNYKVMSTALAKEKNLERITFSRKITIKIFLTYLRLSSAKFYLLVRNPYSRTESFFKNKFRIGPKRDMETGDWQNCQTIFFPYLNLPSEATSKVVAEKMLNLSFKKFIALLPKTYLLDPHLAPQHLAMHVKIIRGISTQLPIRFQRIFKLESSADLQDMKRIFDISLEKKENSTASVKIPIEWGHEESEIMERLFGLDFQRFEYKSFR